MYAITPDQHTEVRALLGRISSALANAPERAADVTRLKRLRAKLRAAVRYNSRVALDYFLADWRAGIKLACTSVEMAA